MSSYTEDAAEAETFPLTSSVSPTPPAAPIVIITGSETKNGDTKTARRLSFNDNIERRVYYSSNKPSRGRLDSSQPSRGRLDSNLQKQSRHSAQLLEVPSALTPDLQSVDRFVTQRSSFDLPTLRQIILILCSIALATGCAGFAIQTFTYIHNSLHWRWSIGFWSGCFFITYAIVGYLTLWWKLGLAVRMMLAKIYFGVGALMGASSVAEMVCAVYTYNHASELIDKTTAPDARSYKISAMEVSIFNSLLAGCGLIGVLLAIFSTSITLHRLNIDLKIAQSFSTLVSRRPSAMNSSMLKFDNKDSLHASHLRLG